MTTLIEAALALAGQGVPVFACAMTKRPATAHGFHDATLDHALIREMFRRPGAELIGVPTGSRSGIVILDGDVTWEADGRATLRTWTQAGRLPRTRTHETRRGGVHLLFRSDPTHGLRSGTGRLAPAVDTRGAGGYAIWWPASGGRVLHGLALAELPMIPAWVIDAAAPPPPARSTRLPGRAEPPSDHYCAAALRRAVERIGAAPEGKRNDTLNAEAFGLARLLGNKISASELTGALLAAAVVAGLPEQEAARTIRSAFYARGAA